MCATVGAMVAPFIASLGYVSPFIPIPIKAGEMFGKSVKKMCTGERLHQVSPENLCKVFVLSTI